MALAENLNSANKTLWYDVGQLVDQKNRQNQSSRILVELLRPWLQVEATNQILRFFIFDENAKKFLEYSASEVRRLLQDSQSRKEILEYTFIDKGWQFSAELPKNINKSASTPSVELVLTQKKHRPQRSSFNFFRNFFRRRFRRVPGALGFLKVMSQIYFGLRREVEFSEGDWVYSFGSSWKTPSYFRELQLQRNLCHFYWGVFVPDLAICEASHLVKRTDSVAFRRWVHRICFHADWFFCGNEKTAKDLENEMRKLGVDKHSKTECLRLGTHLPVVETQAEHSPSSAKFEANSKLSELLNAPFVLAAVSQSMSDRGNSFENLMLAFESLFHESDRRVSALAQLKLVVVCDELNRSDRRVIDRVMRNKILRGRVVVFTRANDSTLSQLYENCLFGIGSMSFFAGEARQKVSLPFDSLDMAGFRTHFKKLLQNPRILAEKEAHAMAAHPEMPWTKSSQVVWDRFVNQPS